jgi:hypothetical protein
MADEVERKEKAPPPFPDVQLVSLWALLTAGVFIASFFASGFPLPSVTNYTISLDAGSYASS